MDLVNLGKGLKVALMFLSVWRFSGTCQLRKICRLICDKAFSIVKTVLEGTHLPDGARQALRMTCFNVPLCETHDLINYLWKRLCDNRCDAVRPVWLNYFVVFISKLLLRI